VEDATVYLDGRRKSLLRALALSLGLGGSSGWAVTRQAQRGVGQQGKWGHLAHTIVTSLNILDSGAANPTWAQTQLIWQHLLCLIPEDKTSLQKFEDKELCMFSTYAQNF
jgi:hypothetical protein